MTTKELLRRLDYYSSLEFASMYFDDDSIECVYRIVVHTPQESITRYSSDVHLYFATSDFMKDIEALYIEKFSRSAFLVQVRYFIGFYNRCSIRQREVLRSSGKLYSLLQYVSK